MKQKLNFIIILRCFAILLVVIGHTLCMYSRQWRAINVTVFDYWQYVVDVIYKIHMPLFVLISGFLYAHVRNGGGYKSWSNFLKKKITRLLIPLLFFGGIECIIDVPFSVDTLISGPLHLWFLRFLFEAFIITRLLDKYLINNPRWLMLFCTLLFLVKPFIHIAPTNQLYHIFRLYPYMLCGIALYGFMKSRWFQMIGKTEAVVAMIIVAFCLLFSTCCKHLEYPIAILFNITLFIGVMTIKFNKAFPSFVYTFDKCGMGIYLMHHPILWNIAKNEVTRSIMYAHPVFAPFVLSTVVIAITWSLSHFILKSKYLHYILG